VARCGFQAAGWIQAVTNNSACACLWVRNVGRYINAAPIILLLPD
jgi:hypothetical protein